MSEREQQSPIYLDAQFFATDLLPALRAFKDEVSAKGVNPLLWFLFGSSVKGGFRQNSDIDVGLIVADGEEDIDLVMYEHPFITKGLEGHEVSPTRFSLSWLARRGHTIETLREQKNLSIYGPIHLLDIDKPEA